QIEDGALATRNLELCYLKDANDLLFIQIQGSARIRLTDGSVLRVNYDSHNGQSYTPVGRILIERGIIPREEMSMDRIRKWMAENPEGGKELRRQNKSYVFFRTVGLPEHEEARGAQGVPLTAIRSIAVDRSLHVYGTPFFIGAELPIGSETSTTKFRRLMIAQDTGSAIVGPARADIDFGAGAKAQGKDESVRGCRGTRNTCGGEVGAYWLQTSAACAAGQVSGSTPARSARPPDAAKARARHRADRCAHRPARDDAGRRARRA